MDLVVMLVFVVALSPMIVAAFVATRAVRAWLALARLVRQRTTPLGDAREGHVEVEGVLRVVGEPIVAPSGARCAALVVHAHRVEAHPGQKKRLHVPAPPVARLARAVLEDDRGARVELGPETRISMQGEGWISGEEPVDSLDPAWRELLVDGPATHVVIEEHRIEEGSRVVVHAVAEPVTTESATPYRGGVGVRLGPPGDEPMLLWRGDERAARRRAAWLSAGMALGVLALFDIAVQVLWYVRGWRQ